MRLLVARNALNTLQARIVFLELVLAVMVKALLLKLQLDVLRAVAHLVCLTLLPATRVSNLLSDSNYKVDQMMLTTHHFEFFLLISQESLFLLHDRTPR